MTHLAREVEDDLATLHQVLHGRFLANVGDVHANSILESMDVEEIAPVLGYHGVYDGDAGAEPREADGEVAPDEAEPSCDQDFLA